MKYIISESQLNSLDLEKMSDVLYKLIQVRYPKNYDYYNESQNVTDVLTEEDGELLFYYNWDRKEFYIGKSQMTDLYEMTGLPFLEYEEMRTNKRGMFNKLMMVFAKQHYGWDVDTVFFHWY
jgi:hypothetical protein